MCLKMEAFRVHLPQHLELRYFLRGWCHLSQDYRRPKESLSELSWGERGTRNSDELELTDCWGMRIEKSGAPWTLLRIRWCHFYFQTAQQLRTPLDAVYCVC